MGLAWTPPSALTTRRRVPGEYVQVTKMEEGKVRESEVRGRRSPSHLACPFRPAAACPHLGYQRHSKIQQSSESRHRKVDLEMMAGFL